MTTGRLLGKNGGGGGVSFCRSTWLEGLRELIVAASGLPYYSSMHRTAKHLSDRQQLNALCCVLASKQGKQKLRACVLRTSFQAEALLGYW